MRQSPGFCKALLLTTATTLAGGWLVSVDAENTSETQNNQQRLADFARKTRLTRPVTPPGAAEAPIHITNKNMQLLAGGVNLTEVTTPAPLTQHDDAATGTLGGTAFALEAQPVATDDSRAVEEVKRDYWRNRYLVAKQALVDAESDLVFLDQEIPKLWNLFYSTDDPVYRDRVIKPRLDDAMNRRETAVARIEEKRSALPAILADAKKDGALPGWFRDIK